MNRIVIGYIVLEMHCVGQSNSIKEELFLLVLTLAAYIINEDLFPLFEDGMYLKNSQTV